MKRLFALVLVAAVGYAAWDRFVPVGGFWRLSDSGDEIIASAFRDHASGIQVTGNGVATRILSDDSDGSRHQRFILKLSSGQTLLVAHNIDLAPRISSLREGDSVEFHGVYDWNSKGGVIHWTHHDPHGVEDGGYVRYRTKSYL